MKLPIVCALITIAAAAPGLLRVPKVYNVVITSNQNLSPSRAFPVIQPVIHRTALGYVPPFYYTQIAPHFAGSQVTHYPPLVTASAKPTGKDPVQASPSTSSSATSRLVESTSFGIGKEHDRRKEETTTRNSDSSNNSPRKNGQVPLSFYPSTSYHSFYYEPYNVHAYNGFNSHLVPPGTYYIDYQPYGSLEPIPATTPKNADSGHLLPSFHDERRDRTRNEEEKIPDVPPPPLPSSVPKRS